MSGVEYIQSLVTPAVKDALIALVKAQPADPVDFLGNFLVHYAGTLTSSEIVRPHLLHCKPAPFPTP